MTTENQSSKRDRNSLFPENIHRAPLDFWRANKLEALVFLVVNLVFGTIGLWLPTVNAFFGPHTMGSAILKQLDDGAFYMYAITFLSAIGGVTFTSIANEKIEHSQSLKVVLAGSVVVFLFVCAILLQAHLFMHSASVAPLSLVKVASSVIQVIVGVITTIVAIYIFSIVTNEQTGSAKEDLDRAARGLLEKAKAAGNDAKGAWKS